MVEWKSIIEQYTTLRARLARVDPCDYCLARCGHSDECGAELDERRVRVRVIPRTPADVEAEVHEFEARYGVPSERMVETFVDGEPDAEQRRWASAWKTLEFLRARQDDDR